MVLWTALSPRKHFIVPRGFEFTPGEVGIRSHGGEERSVDLTSLAPYEVTEAQARRWAKDQLGRTLEELKAGLDDTLADWRKQLDEFNRTPVSESSSITPDAASALLDFVKALPRVVAGSISGDAARIAAAEKDMAGLQQRLKDAGIDVDDRVKAFPGRLADLRRKAGDPAT